MMKAKKDNTPAMSLRHQGRPTNCDLYHRQERRKPRPNQPKNARIRPSMPFELLMLKELYVAICLKEGFVFQSFAYDGRKVYALSAQASMLQR